MLETLNNNVERNGFIAALSVGSLINGKVKIGARLSLDILHAFVSHLPHGKLIAHRFYNSHLDDGLMELSVVIKAYMLIHVGNALGCECHLRVTSLGLEIVEQNLLYAGITDRRNLLLIEVFIERFPGGYHRLPVIAEYPHFHFAHVSVIPFIFQFLEMAHNFFLGKSGLAHGRNGLPQWFIADGGIMVYGLRQCHDGFTLEVDMPEHRFLVHGLPHCP